jgi:DNA polymerase
MNQPDEGRPADPRRHLRAHLESLRAAGVEWLPLGHAAPPAPAPRPAEVISGVPRTTTLFEETRDEAAAEEPPPPPPEARRQALALLADTVAGCTRCAELARKRTQTVFGVGVIDPPICFVGEAPGTMEDAKGEPFVGPAGQLLNRILVACGLKREEMYICNIVKCHPPGDRLPHADEASNCREYLERQLELLRPKYLCALGACAAQNLLNSKTPIGRLRGRFHNYRGIPVLCTYHPSYLLRSPENKKYVWEDMKMLLARMGRPVPGRS